MGSFVEFCHLSSWARSRTATPYHLSVRLVHAAGLPALGVPSARPRRVSTRPAAPILHAGITIATRPAGGGIDRDLRRTDAGHKLLNGLEYPASAARRRPRGRPDRASLPLMRCAPSDRSDTATSTSEAPTGSPSNDMPNASFSQPLRPILAAPQRETATPRTKGTRSPR